MIKHKDLVERLQKKLDKWHTTNAVRLGTLQVEERYAEVVKAIQDVGIPLANKVVGGWKRNEQLTNTVGLRNS